MINRLKPKSEFSRNVLTLMTGTTIAQVIPIAISPILTRLYTPEDFGVFALIMAVSLIFSSIAAGRYDMAIMLPKENSDAIHLVYLSIIISLSFSIVLLFILLIFSDEISVLLNNELIKPWLFTIPIIVALTSLYSVLNVYNSRIKKFKTIKNAVITKSIILSLIQVLFGFFKPSSFGLISASIVSGISSNYRLYKNITLDVKEMNLTIKKDQLFFLAKKFKNFPIYSSWSIFASSISLNIVSLFIGSFFSVISLGFYSIMERTLSMPMILIGNSIGQVFFQNAAQEYKEDSKCYLTFRKTFVKLLLISIPLFIFLSLCVEDIFIFVFGEDWKVAGEYAIIMLPLFMIRFIVVPLTFVTVIINKEYISMFIQTGFLILTTGIFTIFYSINYSLKDILTIYSYSASIYYLFFLIFLYLLSRKRIEKQ